MKHLKTCRIAVAALALFAATGGAVAEPGANFTDHPQPHLERARAIAAQMPGWRHPALITCYRHEGGPSGSAVLVNPLPTQIFDNVWYLGNGALTVYIIRTSEGLILIDTMRDQLDMTEHVLPRMQAAGLDPADIKVVIVSHAHPDHYGGARYLQERFGARVYMSPPDWDWAPIIAASPREQKGFGPPPRRDADALDGGTITLGDTTIRTYFTPGHTPGSLAMLIPVTDEGRPHTIAYLGGVTSKGISPVLHQAFEAGHARFQRIMAEAGVDGIFASHPNYDDAVYRIAQMGLQPNDPNPFITGAAYAQNYVEVVRACNLNNAELEGLGLDGGGFSPDQPDYVLGPNGY